MPLREVVAKIKRKKQEEQEEHMSFSEKFSKKVKLAEEGVRPRGG